jgi:hypothetical protein
MNINPNAVAECLKQNSNTLLDIIQYLKSNEGDNEVINGISCVQASIFTLQVIFAGVDRDGRPQIRELTGERIKPPSNPQPPPDVIIADDDNPEIEDKDIRKIRDEDQSFFR